MANFFLKTIDSKTVVLDFPSTLARKSSDIVVDFPGVVQDDFVTIDAKFPINTSFSAWVSSSDKITVRFNNYTGNTVNLAPFSIRILILKKELNAISGLQGYQGVTGSTGRQGYQGAGSTGRQGYQGAGSTGRQGSQGLQGSAGNEIGIKTINTSKILDLTDNFKFINVLNEALLTIPSDSYIDFPIGSIIYINQYGTGEVSFSTQQGTILNSEKNFKKLNGQFAQAFLIKTNANIWQLSGNIKN